MKAEGKIKKEDAKYFYGEVNPGTADGVQCPYCGIMFFVFATDSPSNPVRSIPISGKVDYYCPCCGKNLKEHLLKAK